MAPATTLSCDTLRVYLIAGQSNAVGAAGRIQSPATPGMFLSGKYAPFANPVNRVYYGERIVDQATLATTRDISLFGRVGPYPVADPFLGRHGVELSLARYLRAIAPPSWNANDRVVLLKFASGGTGIDRWIPSDTSGLNAAFTTWLNAAMEQIAATGCPYTCEDMFWIQGEANTGSVGGATAYLPRFQQLEQQVRAICDFDPVFSKMKYWPDDPTRSAGIDIVNAAMGANYRCTEDNNDLSFLPGEIHYTANSYMRLGLRLGRAARGLV